MVVITQNIDELHARSGSKYILELHGNVVISVIHTCTGHVHLSNLLFLSLNA